MLKQALGRYAAKPGVNLNINFTTFYMSSKDAAPIEPAVINFCYSDIIN